MIQDITLKVIPTGSNSWRCDGCKLNLPKNKSCVEIADEDLVNLILCRECLTEIARFANQHVHLIATAY